MTSTRFGTNIYKREYSQQPEMNKMMSRCGSYALMVAEYTRCPRESW